MDSCDKTDKTCAFCDEPLCEKTIATLTQKGVETIQKACKTKGIDVQVRIGQKVHVLCRSNHTNPRSKVGKRKNSDQPESQQMKTRKSEYSFDYGKCCFYCGGPDPYDGKKPEYKLHPVRAMSVQKGYWMPVNKTRENGQTL